MYKVSLAVAGALVLASCVEDPPEPAAPESPTPLGTVTATPTATATATSSGARAVSEQTDDFFFEYSYPAEAGNIPELASLLDDRLERSRARLSRAAAKGRADARDDGFPYNKYSVSYEWKVVADTPRLLSLSSDFSTYTGGAHGNYTVLSMIWDKQEGKALEPIDLFTSAPALREVTGKAFCDGLNTEREKRRGAPVDPAADDSFNDCPQMDEIVILLGSTDGRAIDRMAYYAGPYVAGSYAEGAYEIDLPVTADLITVVKPDYRAEIGRAHV